jgi:hypothetical protein
LETSEGGDVRRESLVGLSVTHNIHVQEIEFISRKRVF